MKKITTIALIFFVIAIISYMWFGYANIYNRIRSGGLKDVDTQYVYTFNTGLAQEIKYAALGDSLTAGIGADSYEESYPYLLAKDLSSNSNIILKDFSLLGARTEDVIDKGLLEGVIEDKPDIVTLLIGVNDVRENISAKEFKGNYEYLVAE
jgi:lysophospholipase L1-like esterase